jgi:hypothetical protein
MSNKRGGKGAVASTEESVYLDNLLKETSQKIANNNKRFRFSSRIYFNDNDSMGTINYIIPDGGAFYIGDKLLAVFEAKKQGPKGNAIERWYKNNAWCRLINKDVSYITFCSGYVEKDSPLYRILYPFHNGDLGIVDSFSKGKNSVYFQEYWTAQEVKDIMQEILDEIVEQI